MEYIILGYALSTLIFLGWTLKDAQQYSFKILTSFFLLSLAWPIVLIVYYLDKEQ